MLELAGALGASMDVRVFPYAGEGLTWTAGPVCIVLPRREGGALARVRHLRASFRAFKPDLVHAFDFESGIYSRVALMGTRRRCALISGSGAGDVHDRRLRALLNARWFDPDVFVCNSEVGAAALRRHVNNRLPVLVIPNGIDERRMRADADPSIARPSWAGTGRPVVGYVGKFDGLKRADRMIDVARALVGHPTRPIFVLLGGGPQLGEAQARVRELGLAHAVHVPGPDPRASWLAGFFDVGVLCSDSEGFPNALLEYMILGVACVSTRVGDADTILDGGKAGRLVPPGDLAALTNAVRGLLDEPDRRRGLGEAGRTRCLEQYPFDRMVAAHAALYSRMVGRDASPRMAAAGRASA
jgi:glycosyltransferase involved in cell wall biosynthesis